MEEEESEKSFPQLQTAEYRNSSPTLSPNQQYIWKVWSQILNHNLF